MIKLVTEHRFVIVFVFEKTINTYRVLCFETGSEPPRYTTYARVVLVSVEDVVDICGVELRRISEIVELSSLGVEPEVVVVFARVVVLTLGDVGCSHDNEAI